MNFTRVTFFLYLFLLASMARAETEEAAAYLSAIFGYAKGNCQALSLGFSWVQDHCQGLKDVHAHDSHLLPYDYEVPYDPILKSRAHKYENVYREVQADRDRRREEHSLEWLGGFFQESAYNACSIYYGMERMLCEAFDESMKDWACSKFEKENKLAFYLCRLHSEMYHAGNSYHLKKILKRKTLDWQQDRHLYNESSLEEIAEFFKDPISLYDYVDSFTESHRKRRYIFSSDFSQAITDFSKKKEWWQRPSTPRQGYQLEFKASRDIADIRKLLEVVVPILIEKKVDHQYLSYFDHKTTQESLDVLIKVFPESIDYAKKLVREIDKALVTNDLTLPLNDQSARERNQAIKIVGESKRIAVQYAQFHSDRFEGLIKANIEGVVLDQFNQEIHNSYNGRSLTLYSLSVDKFHFDEIKDKVVSNIPDRDDYYRPEWVEDFSID